MTIWVKFLFASLLVLGASLGASVWAAQPSVSVPSTPDVDGKVLIKGRDLVAYTSVTVRFTHAQMTPIDMVTQVGGDGAFAIKFAPPINGGYSVVVFDTGGREIGQGNFGYFR
jgi:hypothetical protein